MNLRREFLALVLLFLWGLGFSLSAQESANLAGTRWAGTETLQGYGRLEFVFQAGGTVTMIDTDGSTPGTWTQNGSNVTLSFYKGTVTYQGKITGQALSGSARNAKKSWSWNVLSQQAGGTFTAANPKSFEKKVVGNGHCVAYVQAAAGLPQTAQWRPGVQVRGNSVPLGTAIATFVDGRYPQEFPKDGKRMHAAIYDGQDAKGIWVYDQWVGQPVHRRHIPFRSGQGARSNDGDAFSVIVAEKK